MCSDTRIKEFTDYALVMRSRLRQQAFSLCGDWQEADDLAQETLVTLYRHWPKLDRHARLDGYVNTVLLRRFLSVRRHLRWRRELSYADPPAPAQHRDNDVVELRLSLVAELKRLPPRQRAVIVLRFWHDLSIEQVAATMNTSPGTVASQCHKALITLRGNLADHRPALNG
jgi:RNA polymerase sigma-70 factor (sigma-E family)